MENDVLPTRGFAEEPSSSLKYFPWRFAAFLGVLIDLLVNVPRSKALILPWTIPNSFVKQYLVSVDSHNNPPQLLAQKGFLEVHD